jgi:hypothetical protein
MGVSVIETTAVVQHCPASVKPPETHNELPGTGNSLRISRAHFVTDAGIELGEKSNVCVKNFDRRR